jgi:PAS domain S-box-containing protein
MKMDENFYTLFKEFIEQDDHPYYFYTHDKDGNVTYISENITQLLGLSSDEFKRDYMSYATANPLNKEMIRYTYRALQGKEQEAYKIEIYDKDFIPHTLLIKEKPMFEGKAIVGLQGVAKLLS